MRDHSLCWQLALLLRVSRGRFWLYLGGTYLVGYAIGATCPGQFLAAAFWLHFVFFIFPGNLLLYGINDLFDADTDSLNPKKGSVEHRLSQFQRPLVCTGVAFGLVLALILAALQTALRDAAVMLAFVLLAIAYSAPPLRLKARPVLDSASNALYAAPGFLAYQQASGKLVPATAVIICALWTSAMHLFSAVPDIESDRKARLATSATLLGHHGSLAVCVVLWLVWAAWLIALDLFRPWISVALIYPAIPAVLLAMQPHRTSQVYWWFPLINSSMGMAAFFAVAVGKWAA